MPEAVHALGGVKRSDERTNVSIHAFDCPFGDFAQKCFQRMEDQLYRIEVRGILRQVAQRCAGDLDHFLHTGDSMERDVVDHNDIPAPERWSQTLLDVGQKSLSIHSSFDRHRRHDAGLTQASDEGDGFPVPHRHMPDQALSALIPTVEPHHVRADCSFVDKYDVGGIKQPLLSLPTSPRPNYVGSLLLRRAQAFF